jgi:dihydroneopterin aldolase
MDQLIIRDLLVEGILGVNPDERTRVQPILVTLALSADTRPASLTDTLTDTISYSEVARAVRRHIAESADLLVEKLAADIARLVLTRFPAHAVRVRVEKPLAMRDAAGAGVEIVRNRADFQLPPL